MKLVSVGLPVYNGAKYLAAALQSLLANDYPRFELLISDNGSTDSTPEICQALAARDPRVRYDRFDTPVQVYDNFNAALGRASGEYFMWAAHDDAWEPNYISSLVEILDAMPGAVIASASFDNLDANGNVVKTYDIDWNATFAAPHFVRLHRFLSLDETRTQKANHIYGLIRREALVRCGGMMKSPVPFSGEDIVTLVRLMRLGTIHVRPECLFHYRVRTPSGPQGEPALQYLVGRVWGRRPPHRGNLISSLRQTSAYFSALRREVVVEPSLTSGQRAALLALLWRRHAYAVTVAPASAALVELRAAGGR